MATQKDIKGRISSVKNIHKITRAMEMVAAARLRRAEQRIERLRPYADAVRKMSRQVARAAGNIPQVPVLLQHETVSNTAILLITGDRGLAGSFNSNILRRGLLTRDELRQDGINTKWYVIGKRGESSLRFRGEEADGIYTGITDRPAFSNAREIADDLMTAYVDQKLDRVDIVYNHYISPLTQVVTRETLLPLQEAKVLAGMGAGEIDESDDQEETDHRALWLYEPDPDEILKRLVPDYAEITVFRAMLESTASEHGARMTAMRNASKNAEEMIEDLTLEANRARQADITQEIMEVVAGAEALG